MSALPSITIEETAVNDIVVLLDAVLPADDIALALDDPGALYTHYRAELQLFRQLIVAEPPPAPLVPRPRAAVNRSRIAGSILR